MRSKIKDSQALMAASLNAFTGSMLNLCTGLAAADAKKRYDRHWIWLIPPIYPG
jgi:hypothetical protein